MSGATVLVTAGRSARPFTTLGRAPQGQEFAGRGHSFDPDCDFCPGNEQRTGQELTRRATADADTWSVRVVRNRYPVLTPDGTGGAAGDAEVVVLSPRHDDRFEDLSVAHLAGALEVIWERAAELSSRFASVLVYVNEGFGAGASMAHLHAQLIALDFASPQLEREIAETDGVADPVRADLRLARDQDLLVHDGEIASWAPWASPYASMVRLAPSVPVEFTSVSPRLLGLLASELQEIIRALQRTLNLGAYNVLFHLRPTGDGSVGSWRVEVVPRRVMFGGFELMSGMIAQDRDPLDTARTLREALRS